MVILHIPDVLHQLNTCMKKFLKVILFGFLILVVLLVVAGGLIPTLFKEDIQKAIDKQIDQSVNARIEYDLDKLDISIFRHFPNVGVALQDIRVIGKGPFAQDTLMDLRSSEVSLNLFSLFGDRMEINGVYVDGLTMNAIINQDTIANYEHILLPTEEEEKPEEEGAPLALNLEEFKFSDINLRYKDVPGGMFAEIKNLNQSGAISIDGNEYDTKTSTEIEEINFVMDHISYVDKWTLNSEIELLIDLEAMKFTFKENEIDLNEFAFGFDGWVSMPDSLTTDMDLSFAAKQTEFKNLLSLVPGVFTEDFKGLKTNGELAFDGFAKGQVTETTVPTFGINLLVKDGMFQYPDLPTSVSNVNIESHVKNEDGILDNTIIELNKFHLDMGTNPVDAKAIIKGIGDRNNIVADMKAHLNLEDLNSIYPIEGTTLKGNFNLAADVNGIYDEAANSLPSVDLNMGLKDGYVKTADLPSALEDLHFGAFVSVPEGNMQAGIAKITDFVVKLNGDKFTTNLMASNFDSPTYELDANGTLNITKLMEMFPIEGTTIEGIMEVHEFNTKGTMADIESENYENLPTSGSITLKNFFYKEDELLPQGFKMSTGEMSFTPEQINISKAKGYVGKSDYTASGFIRDYMAYTFRDETVKGEMDFYSMSFDVNEWMMEDSTATEAAPSPEAIEEEVAEVPKNIDFILHAKLDKVLYDNLVLQNMTGDVIVKGGIARMKNLRFNMLGGGFVMNGEYNTQDLAHPKFAMDMDIANLGIGKSFEAFNTVQMLAPIAKNTDGSMSGVMKMSGELGKDMLPLYNTMTGGGAMKIANAVIKEMNVMNQVKGFSKFSNFDPGTKSFTIKDQTVKFKFVDGGVLLEEPITFNAGSTPFVLTGKGNFDGSLQYDLETELPVGSAGQSVNNALGSLGLKNAAVGDKVQMTFGIGGTATDPKLSLKKTTMAGDSGQSIEEEAKERAKSELDAAKKEAEAKARAEAEKAQKEAEARVKAEAEKAQKEAEAKAKAEADKAKKEAEAKAKKEADKLLKDKLKKPW